MNTKHAYAGKHIDQYKSVHDDKAEYGSGSRHFEYVRMLVTFCRFAEVIDYGCGKGALADELNLNSIVHCTKYDPAISDYDELPARTFDAVVNTDVLEHVPESELPSILGNFTSLSPNAVIIPHLAKAREILPNGENAHCTIKSPEEWQAIFQNHYAYVLRLPHESSKHALFLCTEKPVQSDAIELAANHILRAAENPDEVKLSLNAPFKSRFFSAGKLLLGGRAVRAARRLIRSR